MFEWQVGRSLTQHVENIFLFFTKCWVSFFPSIFNARSRLNWIWKSSCCTCVSERWAAAPSEPEDIPDLIWQWVSSPLMSNELAFRWKLLLRALCLYYRSSNENRKLFWEPNRPWHLHHHRLLFLSNVTWIWTPASLFIFNRVRLQAAI